MATRVISTSIKLDGEAEFKRQLGEVNSNLRNMDSEMRLVTEQFKGQANSVEALGAKQKVLTGQIDQQTEKVRALEKAYRESKEVNGENSKATDGYQQSLNRAKAELMKMQRELDDTNRYMDEAKRSTDGAAKSIDEFGKAAKESDEGGLAKMASSLGSLKGLLTGGVIATGLKGLADGISNLVEETEEYRKVMGALASSSEAAGYSTEETSEAYTRLYGILGDTQTTATTVANLQAIGLNQEVLMRLIDLTTGAWAKYGDSIPIDGLAESINETIRVGQVTGTFADVLNWAGTSEDEFNEKLAESITTTGRANIVLEEMADQGLADIAQGYRDAESATIDANEAQANYEKAQAELAEKLLPAKTALTELATMGWDVLSQSIQTAMTLWNEAAALFGKEKNLRKDGLLVDEKDRMAAYGYEAYYNEEGLLRYRKAEETLAGTDVREQSVQPADLYGATAAAVNSQPWKTANPLDVTSVKTTINIDGRAVAEAVTPALRDVNKANPEVVSDLL